MLVKHISVKEVQSVTIRRRWKQQHRYHHFLTYTSLRSSSFSRLSLSSSFTSSAGSKSINFHYYLCPFLSTIIIAVIISSILTTIFHPLPPFVNPHHHYFKYCSSPLSLSFVIDIYDLNSGINIDINKFSDNT